jgi:hypothetical protein
MYQQLYNINILYNASILYNRNIKIAKNMPHPQRISSVCEGRQTLNTFFLGILTLTKTKEIEPDIKVDRVKHKETCLFLLIRSSYFGVIAFPLQHLAYFNHLYLLQKLNSG